MVTNCSFEKNQSAFRKQRFCIIYLSHNEYYQRVFQIDFDNGIPISTVHYFWASKIKSAIKTVTKLTNFVWGVQQHHKIFLSSTVEKKVGLKKLLIIKQIHVCCVNKDITTASKNCTNITETVINFFSKYIFFSANAVQNKINF